MDESKNPLTEDMLNKFKEIEQQNCKCKQIAQEMLQFIEKWKKEETYKNSDEYWSKIYKELKFIGT